MLKKINSKIIALMILSLSLPAIAFDLEDYATTYRATRDAYLKAANELKLSTGPYKSARDAYIAANIKYNQSLGSPDDIRIATEKSKRKLKCLEDYKGMRDEYYANFKK
jgi:hypothetical protein